MKIIQMFLKIVAISFLSFILAASASAQKIILATDFGIKANSFENASPAICKAIESCKSIENATLVLPGGRIDLWPEGAVKRVLYISNSTEDDTLSKFKNIGLFIENFENLTIEGNNTLVVLHGKMISFAILNSKNIKFQNISFDYERPTMSELIINSVSDNSVETIIHPDSRYSIDNGKFCFYGEGWKVNSYHTIVFEPDNNLMKYSSFKPFISSMAFETSPFHVKFDGDFTNSQFRKGDILTVRDPYRDNCGGFISRSKDIRLENVKLHYMHGLGIVSQFSENITLFKVRAAPRANSGRIISCFADCFHFSGCKGKILIDSCFTSGSHDDPVNVHGTHLQITSIGADKKLMVRFMHHQTYGFNAFFTGDSIAFVNPQTLQPVAFAMLKNAILLNNREMLIEIDGVMPENVISGLCIENLTWTPEVIIRNSRFERTNTRGLLLTTRRKILIENNTFYRTGMHAILIADDASNWFESGAVQDVTIRNNTFTECGYNSVPGNFVIAIAPENHQVVPGYFVHRNICIENNTFSVYDYPILSARSVDNLSFTGNTVKWTTFMKNSEKRAGFDLTSSKNVNLKNNLFEMPEVPMIRTKGMRKKDMKTDSRAIIISIE
jgi:hypothetical protein